MFIWKIAVLLLAMPLVSYVFGLLGESAASPYATLVMRALGVAVVSETVAGICRESKEASVASYIEMAGRLEILMGKIVGRHVSSEMMNGNKGLSRCQRKALCK